MEEQREKEHKQKHVVDLPLGDVSFLPQNRTEENRKQSTKNLQKFKVPPTNTFHEFINRKQERYQCANSKWKLVEQARNVGAYYLDLGLLELSQTSETDFVSGANKMRQSSASSDYDEWTGLG